MPTITNVTDVPAASTSSLLQGERGRTLLEPSRVQCFANRESADVSFDSFIGSESQTVQGGAAVNAVAGDLPTKDNILFDGFGSAGDEIVIQARNVNAAAQEARVLVLITAIDDNALNKAMDNLGLTQPFG